MPLFCWFDHFSDSMAEICQIFRWFFGKFKISKRHSEINWPLRRPQNFGKNISVLLYCYISVQACKRQSKSERFLQMTFLKNMNFKERQIQFLFCFERFFQLDLKREVKKENVLILWILKSLQSAPCIDEIGRKLQ